jgi:opacity protein-like surface antigen
MFRSLSGFRLFTRAAAAILIATAVAAIPGQAQNRRITRETNANRRARIERIMQDTYTHRWEVGGGGGYLRFRSGEFTQKNSEITFWLNTTYYLNEKLGLTAEVRGAYGNAKTPNYNPFQALVGNPQISEYPFLVGPTYRFRLRQHTAVSAFAMAGTAVGKFDSASKGIPASQLGFWPSTNARPAFSVGANLDLNVYPNLAFRIAPNYLGTTFGGNIQNNLGFNMGLVYRFGRQ